MRGKIYRLSNGDKHYYGSTTEKYLSSRLAKHNHNNNNDLPCSSKMLYDSIEYKISIDLMEEIEYENKDDLLLLERWWIENNECVNKRIPHRTIEDKRLSTIKCRDKNKDKYNKNRNEKIKCECGCIISKSSKYEHIKTKKHIKLMNK